MPESPSPQELFLFGLRVAWHICGCTNSEKRYFEFFRVLEQIDRGDLVLEDSPADRQKKNAQVIEEMRQTTALMIEKLRQTDDAAYKKRGFLELAETFGHRKPGQSDDEVIKDFLERIDREGIEKVIRSGQEDYCKRRIATDRTLAKYVRIGWEWLDKSLE